jgi:hypothetical protein
MGRIECPLGLSIKDRRRAKTGKRAADETNGRRRGPVNLGRRTLRSLRSLRAGSRGGCPYIFQLEASACNHHASALKCTPRKYGHTKRARAPFQKPRCRKPIVNTHPPNHAKPAEGCCWIRIFWSFSTRGSSGKDSSVNSVLRVRSAPLYRVCVLSKTAVELRSTGQPHSTPPIFVRLAQGRHGAAVPT